MTKKKDTYTILEISEKSRDAFQIAYAVESEDIPRFKAIVSVPMNKPKEDIIDMVNASAYTQLTTRREKIAQETREQEERESIERLRDALKADIESMKGTGTPIKKPKEKKKQLEAPASKE